VKKVGVFVDLPLKEVLDISDRMGYDAVQLHGSESPGECREAMKEGFQVIKAFNIDRESDFKKIEPYLEACDLILMDAAGGGFGGTGRKFDWAFLDGYEYGKPFMLSGGIGPKDAEKILEIRNPRLFGIDLNSRFETEPGLKDRALLSEFMDRIRGASREITRQQNEKNDGK
jgi:phosphoribosylanthranilate isomerase